MRILKLAFLFFVRGIVEIFVFEFGFSEQIGRFRLLDLLIDWEERSEKI